MCLKTWIMAVIQFMTWFRVFGTGPGFGLVFSMYPSFLGILESLVFHQPAPGAPHSAWGYPQARKATGPQGVVCSAMFALIATAVAACFCYVDCLWCGLASYQKITLSFTAQCQEAMKTSHGKQWSHQLTVGTSGGQAETLELLPT